MWRAPAQPLPRLLWELGGSAPDTSRCALRALHDAARYAQPGGPISNALLALQPHLALLYASAMPQKTVGGKGEQKLRGKPGRKGAAGARGAPGAGGPKDVGMRKGDGDGGDKGHRTRLLPGPLAQLPLDCQASAPANPSSAMSCSSLRLCVRPTHHCTRSRIFWQSWGAMPPSPYPACRILGSVEGRTGCFGGCAAWRFGAGSMIGV